MRGLHRLYRPALPELPTTLAPGSIAEARLLAFFHTTPRIAIFSTIRIATFYFSIIRIATFYFRIIALYFSTIRIATFYFSTIRIAALYFRIATLYFSTIRIAALYFRIATLYFLYDVIPTRTGRALS